MGSIKFPCCFISGTWTFWWSSCSRGFMSAWI